MKHIDIEQLKTASFIAGQQELYQLITNGTPDCFNRSNPQIREIRLDHVNINTRSKEREINQWARRLRQQANAYGLVAHIYKTDSRGHKTIRISTPSYSYRPKRKEQTHTGQPA